MIVSQITIRVGAGHLCAIQLDWLLIAEYPPICFHVLDLLKTQLTVIAFPLGRLSKIVTTLSLFLLLTAPSSPSPSTKPFVKPPHLPSLFLTIFH